MTEERSRHSNDGKAYYCTFCGAGFGEYLACEGVHCDLEKTSAAEARRQRWLDGMAKNKDISLNVSIISIMSILHKDQRYDTCGDWYYDEFGTLKINVSMLKDRKEMILIAIHELIEAALCEAKGITQDQVDEFDKMYEGTLSSIVGNEPGDSIEAPYYKQHQIATGIERILAAELGVDWLTYEQHIKELSQ